jgi:hypothetical protein
MGAVCFKHSYKKRCISQSCCEDDDIEDENNKEEKKSFIEIDSIVIKKSICSIKSSDSLHSDSDTILFPLNYRISDISCILDNLYMGSYFDACCLCDIQKKNITNVINLSEIKHGNWFIYKKSNIKNYQFCFNFDQNEISLKRLNDIIIIINNCVKNNENILVHCEDGKIYSPTIIIYYLLNFYESDRLLKSSSLENNILYLCNNFGIQYDYVNVNFIKYASLYSEKN